MAVSNVTLQVTLNSSTSATVALVDLRREIGRYAQSHAWTAKAIPQQTGSISISGRVKTVSKSQTITGGMGAAAPTHHDQTLTVEPGIKYKFQATFIDPVSKASRTLSVTKTMANNNTGTISITSIDASFVNASFTTSPTKLRQIKVYAVNCTLSRPEVPVGASYLDRISEYSPFSKSADGSAASGTASVMHGLTPASIPGASASNDGDLAGVTVGLYDLSDKRLSYKTGMLRIPLKPEGELSITDDVDPVVDVSYKAKRYAQRIKLYFCRDGQDYPETPQVTVDVAASSSGTRTITLGSILGVYGNVLHKVKAEFYGQVVTYTGTPSVHVDYSSTYMLGQAIEKTVTPVMPMSIEAKETTPDSLRVGASPLCDLANLSDIGARISFMYKRVDSAVWIAANRDEDAYPVIDSSGFEAEHTIEGLDENTGYDVRAVMWTMLNDTKVEIGSTSAQYMTAHAPTKITVLRRSMSTIKFNVDLTDTTSYERVLTVSARKHGAKAYQKVYSYAIPAAEVFSNVILTLRYLADGTDYDILAEVTRNGALVESARTTVSTLSEGETDNSRYAIRWVRSDHPNTSGNSRHLRVAVFLPDIYRDIDIPDDMVITREVSTDGEVWTPMEYTGGEGDYVEEDGLVLYGWYDTGIVSSTSRELYLRAHIYVGINEAHTNPIRIFCPGYLEVPEIEAGDAAVISASMFNYYYEALMAMRDYSPSRNYMPQYVEADEGVTAQILQDFVELYNYYFEASIDFVAGDIIKASTIVSMLSDIAEAW